MHDRVAKARYRRRCCGEESRAEKATGALQLDQFTLRYFALGNDNIIGEITFLPLEKRGISFNN